MNKKCLLCDGRGRPCRGCGRYYAEIDRTEGACFECGGGDIVFTDGGGTVHLACLVHELLEFSKERSKDKE